ncbi:hypothetical protein LTR17_016906 [Elasticomyces elasticus]|nr:hypothetical protein LTR17_016906 [Elasticomyces elasticus]
MDGASIVPPGGQESDTVNKIQAYSMTLETMLMSAYEKIMHISTPLEEKIVRALEDAKTNPSIAATLSMRFSDAERQIILEAYEPAIEGFTTTAAFLVATAGHFEKDANEFREVAKKNEALVDQYQASELPNKALKMMELREEAEANYASATKLDKMAATAREDGANLQPQVALLRYTCMVLRPAQY